VLAQGLVARTSATNGLTCWSENDATNPSKFRPIAPTPLTMTRGGARALQSAMVTVALCHGHYPKRIKGALSLDRFETLADHTAVSEQLSSLARDV